MEEPAPAVRPLHAAQTHAWSDCYIRVQREPCLHTTGVYAGAQAPRNARRSLPEGVLVPRPSAALLSGPGAGAEGQRVTEGGSQSARGRQQASRGRTGPGEWFLSARGAGKASWKGQPLSWVLQAVSMWSRERRCQGTVCSEMWVWGEKFRLT